MIRTVYRAGVIYISSCLSRVSFSYLFQVTIQLRVTLATPPSACDMLPIVCMFTSREEGAATFTGSSNMPWHPGKVPTVTTLSASTAIDSLTLTFTSFECFGQSISVFPNTAAFAEVLSNTGSSTDILLEPAVPFQGMLRDAEFNGNIFARVRTVLAVHPPSLHGSNDASQVVQV